jgi:hypothetical protein
VTDPMWQTHIIMDDELDEGEIDPNRTAPNSPAKGMHTLFFRPPPIDITTLTLFQMGSL